MNPNLNFQEPEEKRELAAAKQTKADKKRQKNQISLDQLRDAISMLAQQGLIALARLKVKSDRLDKLERENPGFANAGPRGIMRHNLIALALAVVTSLNFFLVHAPIEYLSGLAFAQENSWQAQIATIIIPLALLLLEIYISISLRQAKLHYPENIQTWVWTGKFMIAFTPLMLFGTMLAKEDWSLHNFVITGALMILAGVTDAAIIFGGEQIQESLGFIGYKFSCGCIQRDKNYFEAKYRKAGRLAEQGYDRYTRILNEHNSKYPNHSLKVGLFSRNVAKFLNEWLEQEVIQLPPQSAPSATLSHPEPDSPHSHQGIDTEIETEQDYYRDLLNDQIRKNNREVPPED